MRWNELETVRRLGLKSKAFDILLAKRPETFYCAAMIMYDPGDDEWYDGVNGTLYGRVRPIHASKEGAIDQLYRWREYVESNGPRGWKRECKEGWILKVHVPWRYELVANTSWDKASGQPAVHIGLPTDDYPVKLLSKTKIWGSEDEE